MNPIFISYRRIDLSLEAEWIYNLICAFFGDEMVFFDKEEIESGKRWDETLHTSIEEANIVFILIGPKWLKVQAESGMRRLDDPEDWVRKEIYSAISNFKKQADSRWIFPVLLNGASLPKKEWLPNDLQELASFQIEKGLEFDIKNYVDVASKFYEFINNKISLLKLTDKSIKKPFKHELIPNPYEILGYQLPEYLRTSRPSFPFKGLEFFKKEDARIFFGRRKEIGEIIDHFKKSKYFLRLYGQSGVGKSSLLHAGLFPKMENNGWIIRYFRRDKNILLSNSLLQLIDELNKSDNNNSLIILDQVEEIITNPNIEVRGNELEFLTNAICHLMEINKKREHVIQLILSYRKEYDVNIKSGLQDKNIITNEYWLKDLSEDGMKDAITGIIKDQDLNDEYHLQIEKGLEDLIISELLNKGQNNDSSPLLQTLLRKMWDKVCKLDIENRIFTYDLYAECKSRDLQNFLKERLESLFVHENDSEYIAAVKLGLPLDVLLCFTTEQDTACSQSENTIIAQYSDITLCKKILQALVDAYLLIRLNSEAYRIPHDTLAKVVRIQYNNSVLPGQRAAILLNSKKIEIDNGDDVEFSKADLSIINSGKPGMRKWYPNEEKVINASLSKIVSTEKTIAEQKEQIQKSLDESLKANSYSIINFSRISDQLEDYGKTFRFSELAYEVSENIATRSYLVKSFSKLTGNYIFKIPELRSFEGFRSMILTKDGILLLGSVKGKLLKLNYENKTITQVIDCSKRKINSIKASSNFEFYISASDDRLVIWDKDFNEVRAAESTYFNLGDINSAEFSSDLSKIVIAFDGGRILLTDMHFKIIKEIVVGRHLVNSVTLSPDGNFIICTTNDSKMYLYNSKGDKLSEYKNEERPVKKCSFSPDGKMIVTASEDGTARFFDFSLNNSIDNPIVFDGQMGHVNSAEFSPDSTMVVTCASVIKVWDCKTGQCLVSMENNELAQVARFSNDSNGIFVIGGNGISYYLLKPININENLKSIAIPWLSSGDLNDITIDNIDNSRPGFDRIQHLLELNNPEIIKPFAQYYKELGEIEYSKRKFHFKRALILYNYLKTKWNDYYEEDFDIERMKRIVETKV